MEEERGRRALGELLRPLTGAQWPDWADDRLVRGLAVDSKLVRPGDVFVAIPGTREDGRDYVPDAIERGATAIVTNGAVVAGDVPVVRVANARRALAELAAVWYAWEARALPLVGITGTFGKTSILAMLDAIMTRALGSLGVIGSEALGVRLRGARLDDSSLTTPDPLELHRHLAALRRAGADMVALEVTSQALEQHRVHGLRFDLGIFTTLVPLEHTEYHPTFRDYVAAKALFLDHLGSGAPLLYGSDNLALHRLVQQKGVRAIGCGTGDHAVVTARDEALSLEGTSFRLSLNHPLPRIDGGSVGPLELDLRLRLLGAPAVLNASLAAGAALCMGAPGSAVREALAEVPTPFRRMEILYRGDFTVMDDTAGHPDSVSATFDVIRRLRSRSVHVVFGVRGQRGPLVNEAEAAALGLWAMRVPLETLIVTASEDTADERNRVAPEEASAFLRALERQGAEYRYVERLEEAVRTALARVQKGDLLLLIGAQGMDRARDFLRERVPDPMDPG